MLADRPGDHYTIKSGPFSSHSQILRRLGAGHGRSVLDVGCAQGDVSLFLLQQGWDVLGIEPHPPSVAIARAKGLEVIPLPIEDALSALTKRFDAIVLADVLEHLVDPWQVMNLLPGLLKPRGLIIASIPNAAFLYVRLMLLMGRFNYMDSGILDSTHLRFFTRKSSIQLIESANFDVTRVNPTPIPLERLIPRMPVRGPISIVHALNYGLSKIWSRGFGYQFIIEGSPNSYQ